MPPGYLFTVLFIGTCALLQLIPVPRKPPARVASFWTSMLVNEQPHWFAAFLVASTALALAQGDINSAAGWICVAVAAIVLAGLIVLFLRSFPSRRVLREAINSFDPDAVRRTRERKSYLPTLLGPFAFGRSRARRTADIGYGPHGKRNLLDVYRPRHGNVTGPTLIFLHGGGFKSGAKKREGQLALYRLAARGWVCISANYRLSPEVQFPDYVVDLKRVISWAKSDGAEYGVDPERIFLAGSSAGGHISATAALTVNDPRLQPGFEEVDTTVAGTIGLYGYYGGLSYGSLRPQGPIPSSPTRLVHPEAPPFLIIHGERDTVVSVGNAAALVDRLDASRVPVSYAVLPGAQHTFDLLRSVRAENTVDAIDDFAHWVLSR